MSYDKLIANGHLATVYKSGNYAVKVFDKNISKTDVLNEALNTSRVEETGLNIPKIQEISKENNTWSITMDLIEGKTLATLMNEHPENLEHYLDKMVDLQLLIQSKTSPLLNKLKDKLIKNML